MRYKPLCIVFMLISLIAAGTTHAATLKTVNLANEKEIYALGRSIAEGVALSFVVGMQEVDANLKYDIKFNNDKFSAQGNTWPIIDVKLEISSPKLQSPMMTFVLFLEASGTTDRDRGYIFGTVKNIKVDGKQDQHMAVMNNKMFSETDEGTTEIAINNGKIFIVD